MQPESGDEPAFAIPQAIGAIRERVEEVLRGFLQEQRAEIAAVDEGAVLLVDELARVVGAGGKRIRPTFCYWGYRAAGGADGEPIVRAAAALELLHTFALIHDDVMDASETRRGVATSHVYLAAEHRRRGLPGAADRFGLSSAVLVGDVAVVLADRLLRDSGFPSEELSAALLRYDRMRLEMAAGQFLDLEGTADPRRIASLKTGSYTVEGPLQIGATLAGGSPEVMASLSRYGAPLGQAFQLRDDLLDAREDAVRDPGASRTASPEDVNELVAEACAELDTAVLAPEAVDALRLLAELIALR